MSFAFSLDFSVYEKGRKAPQYTIESDIDGELTLQEFLQFCKTNLIVIADTVLKEEQSQGFDKEPLVIVDGRPNKPVINVNPLGSISFVARQNAKDVMLEIFKGILERSPVDTGQYKKSNFVLYNGEVVASDMSSLANWLLNREFKPKDLVRFINVMPYARKLERYGIVAGGGSQRLVKSRDRKQRSGRRTANKKISDNFVSILNPGKFIQAPNGAYYLTLRSVQRKYKFNAKISFELVPGSWLRLASFPPGVDKNGKKLYTTYHRKKKDTGVPYLYPSIKVVIQEEGTL